MRVYKDKERDTWYVKFYYRDFTGRIRPKMKRGFIKKTDAMEYEYSFKNQRSGLIDIPFKDFYALYMEYSESRHRPSTVVNKREIIEKHILPYFDEKKMCDIRASDIIAWQNVKMEEEHLPTYLRAMHARLSAIFNHAVNIYDLPSNPCRKAGAMGSKKSQTVDFWTLEEYRRILPHLQNNPRALTGIQILYWAGLRVGEMLALPPADYRKDQMAISVNKTWQVIEGEEHVGPPKTESSRRLVSIPQFLGEQIEKYMGMLYKCPEDERIFEGCTHAFFSNAIDRASGAADVKQIRVHDLRHSHVSLLIHLGYDYMMIAKRIGHTDIRYVPQTYGHLYPEVHTQLARRLEEVNEQDVQRGRPTLRLIV